MFVNVAVSTRSLKVHITYMCFSFFSYTCVVSLFLILVLSLSRDGAPHTGRGVPSIDVNEL